MLCREFASNADVEKSLNSLAFSKSRQPLGLLVANPMDSAIPGGGNFLPAPWQLLPPGNLDSGQNPLKRGVLRHGTTAAIELPA
jgi:hypothetical protein